MSEPTRTIVCAPPSQLAGELAKANGMLAVVVRDEPRSLEGMLTVLSYMRLRAVDEVDLGAFGPFDRDESVNADLNILDENMCGSAALYVPVFYSAVVELTSLTRLRLGRTCLDQTSDADVSDK